MRKRNLLLSAVAVLALAGGVTIAPASAAPVSGRFCGTADHGVTVGSLTCVQDGRWWRWLPTVVETPEPSATVTPEPSVTATPEPSVTETPEPSTTETPTGTTEPTTGTTPDETIDPSPTATTPVCDEVCVEHRQKPCTRKHHGHRSHNLVCECTEATVTKPAADQEWVWTYTATPAVAPLTGVDAPVVGSPSFTG